MELSRIHRRHTPYLIWIIGDGYWINKINKQLVHVYPYLEDVKVALKKAKALADAQKQKQKEEKEKEKEKDERSGMQPTTDEYQMKVGH